MALNFDSIFESYLILASLLSISILVGVITVLLIYTRWNYGSLESLRGLPAIVPPYFVGGSDPFFYKKYCWQEDIARVKKYGSVFGMYEGRSAEIHVADPELIKEIFIRDFEYFCNERSVNFGDPLLNEFMSMLPYSKWKVVRSQLTPQFSSAALRRHNESIHGAIDNWMKRLEVKKEKSTFVFDVRREFAGLATDLIARCAFGTKVEDPDDPNDELAVNVSYLLGGEGGATFKESLAMALPFISSLQPIFPPEMVSALSKLITNILDVRNPGEKSSMGIVGCLNKLRQQIGSSEFTELGISNATVLGQGILFLLSGIDTVANTLSLAAFLLAKYPEVQEKLLAEIDAYDGGDGDNIRQLAYTNAVISETLRLYPVLVRVERLCVKDWVHKESGLEIKKGMNVQVPIFAVHYNEKYFPNPEQFKPERFLPENKDKLNPYTFLSFGQGPHNCIAMRLAREEMLITFAVLLKKYKFQSVPGSEVIRTKGNISINYYKKFDVSLVERDRFI